MNLFVDVDWLTAHLHDEDIAIVDTRSTPHGAPGAVAETGRDAYAKGHIPGAVHLDYAEDLHDLSTPYAARVADPQRFAQVVGAAGIGDATRVIAYDEGNVPYAARMVWMFRYYGHDDAAILAGGVRDWLAAGKLFSTEAAAPKAKRFTPKARLELRATKEEVLAVAEGRSDAQLLETQRDGTYAMRDVDIKGARRLSGSQLLEDARGGRIAPSQRLRDLVQGLDPHKRTIVSCGSGVAASGSYLALLEAGFTNVAVYDGSWMEWSHDEMPTVPKTPS